MDMTIRERLQKGMLYTDMGEGLPEERLKCQELLYDYNSSRPGERTKRTELLRQLMGTVGKEPWIEPNFRAAYGKNIFLGDYFYSNFNLVIVDDTKVHIGSHVMVAPNVTITSTGHPVDAELRRPGTQFSIPVVIGDDVWIGAGAVILPGVTVGNGAVIGAGSVVTRDIPANVVAVGNPCRVLRTITSRDRQYYYKDFKADELFLK